LNIKEFASLHDHLRAQRIFFYYTGEFTAAIIESISDALRARLAVLAVPAARRMRVLPNFIEMAHNIMHYSAAGGGGEGETGTRRGSVVIGVDSGGHYWIACCNRIQRADQDYLARRLGALQSMTAEELVIAYKKQLINDDHEETDERSRGAGLGFITIARDSMSPPEFDFIADTREPDLFSLFYIRSIIK